MWKCASFEIVCRILSSIVPLTSPPSTCTMRMFMSAPQAARERTSKRSPCTMRTSGFKRSMTSGSLTIARPTDSTIAASSSPLTIVWRRLSIVMPSFSINRYVDLQNKECSYCIQKNEVFVHLGPRSVCVCVCVCVCLHVYVQVTVCVYIRVHVHVPRGYGSTCTCTATSTTALV